MHKGKTVKKGALVAQIKKAVMTVEEFLKYHKLRLYILAHLTNEA